MSGNMLYIHKGILIYGQKLYFLSKEMNIVVNPGNQWQVLRIRIGNMNKAKNFLIGDMQLELTSDVQESKDKIEICRFRCRTEHYFVIITEIFRILQPSLIQ